MSKDDVKNFFVTLAKDQAAADQLAAAKNDAEFIDKVFKFAGQRGVTLNRADVEAYLADLRAAATTGEEELTDDQLADVAGGAYSFNVVNKISKLDPKSKDDPSSPGASR